MKEPALEKGTPSSTVAAPPRLNDRRGMLGRHLGPAGCPALNLVAARLVPFVMVNAPTLGPHIVARVKVLLPPPPLRATFWTGTVRAASVIWLLPVPPLTVKFVRGHREIDRLCSRRTCEPEAVMVLLPAAPLTMRLFAVVLAVLLFWMLTGPARLPRSTVYVLAVGPPLITTPLPVVAVMIMKLARGRR